MRKRKDGLQQKCAHMEICKRKYARGLVTNMKKRWTNTKVCFHGNMQRKICQSSCHEYEGVWVVREGEGKDLAWRTNLNFEFVLFLEQKLENFALSLWAKSFLFFTFDKKIRCPKLSRGKMGTWRKWPFHTCASLFPGFDFFLATHMYWEENILRPCFLVEVFLVYVILA